MPPKKKKQPANAFYFFMLDRKVSYERNGERFQNGLRDVAEIAGPEWEVLPAAERKKYEDLAREEKARQKGDTSRKYTNQHNSFDYMDKTLSQEREATENMNRDINSTINLLCNSKKLAHHKFYLIHMNYFCITEGECYHPAEIAVCEFSLAEGVSNVYHTIINSGNIPLGYRHDALKNSDTVHHIPLEPEDGERNFYKIWSRLKAVLEPGRNANGGVYPPLYTMQDNVSLNTSISCVKSVLKTLCETNDDNYEDFPVYKLDRLFYELKNGCAQLSGMADEGDGWDHDSLALCKLETDTYNYTPEIACSFHYNEDQVVNCSKSFVQRWAFLMCDECCQYLNIDLVPGKHVPKDSDVNFRQQHAQREMEREAEAAAKKAAPKDFTMVHSATGRSILATRQGRNFMPVEIERPPLPQPTVRATIATPHPFENSEDNFPAIPVGGRGRGRVTPRGAGGGRGSQPMSFAAAMQSRK